MCALLNPDFVFMEHEQSFVWNSNNRFSYSLCLDRLKRTLGYGILFYLSRSFTLSYFYLNSVDKFSLPILEMKLIVSGSFSKKPLRFF